MTTYLETTHRNVIWFKRAAELEELQMAPPFQRNPVWTERQKSYLIDTILRGYPIPEIYMQDLVQPNAMQKHIVVDGQQRVRACLEFLEGKFELDPKQSPDFADLTFDELRDDEKQKIYEYRFVVRLMPRTPDSILRDIFQRLNRNNVALNAQELRQATYWGPFIQSMNRLSRTRNNLWTNGTQHTRGSSSCKPTLRQYSPKSSANWASFFPILSALGGVRSPTSTHCSSFWQRTRSHCPLPAIRGNLRLKLLAHFSSLSQTSSGRPLRDPRRKQMTSIWMLTVPRRRHLQAQRTQSTQPRSSNTRQQFREPRLIWPIGVFAPSNWRAFWPTFGRHDNLIKCGKRRPVFNDVGPLSNRELARVVPETSRTSVLLTRYENS